MAGHSFPSGSSLIKNITSSRGEGKQQREVQEKKGDLTKKGVDKKKGSNWKRKFLNKTGMSDQKQRTNKTRKTSGLREEILVCGKSPLRKNGGVFSSKRRTSEQRGTGPQRLRVQWTTNGRGYQLLGEKGRRKTYIQALKRNKRKGRVVKKGGGVKRWSRDEGGGTDFVGGKYLSFRGCYVVSRLCSNRRGGVSRKKVNRVRGGGSQ